MQQELLKHFGYTGFCFEGRESSIGWDLRLISCPADLGSGLTGSNLWPDTHFISRNISSWIEERFSNPQSLRHSMSLLHIHFMKVRGGCSWSFPPDLPHGKCLAFFFLVGNPIVFCTDSFQCCRHFSLAQQLHPDLCPNPCPCAGGGGLQGTERWGEKMERFSSSGLFYVIAKTSWNSCSGVCSSHQTQKEFRNLVMISF